MRFFADHGVSNSIVKILRDSGQEVLRLKDHLPVESEDSVVIAEAEKLDAVLLSLNGDFADIAAFPPSKFKGIVALQIGNRPQLGDALMKRMSSRANRGIGFPRFSSAESADWDYALYRTKSGCGGRVL